MNILKLSSRLLFFGIILSNQANAKYEVYIGLTESKKGPLPNDSVLFTGKVVPKIQCEYDSSRYYWQKALGGSSLILIWDSTTIASTANTSLGIIDHYDFNGYRYTSDERMTFAGPPKYKICREKL